MALSPLKGRHKYLSGCTINGVSRATDAAHFVVGWTLRLRQLRALGPAWISAFGGKADMAFAGIRFRGRFWE